jgi:uncharacterized membrane protein
LPTVLVGLSVILAFGFLAIDRTFDTLEAPFALSFFEGTADAAQGLLSTIATSLITVISIAFSITIIILQAASTQYSPRVLRNFTRDKGNQIILGTYLATFVYALLVLRSVRNEDGGVAEFVPELSITFALVLTLICVALLIYFISHVSTSIQVENIVRNIDRALIAEIETLFPQPVGKTIDTAVPAETVFSRLHGGVREKHLRAARSGFVHSIDHGALAKVRAEGVRSVLVMPKVGEFVVKGQPIVKVGEAGPVGDYDAGALIKAVILDDQRSVEQDPLFAVSQLVDVALRALSTGLNDPTTAQYCLYRLSDALVRLVGRKFPANQATFGDNPIIYIFNQPTWAEFVDAALSQIRRAAALNVRVTHTLIRQVGKIASFAPPYRAAPLLHQLEEMKKNIDSGSFSPADKAQLSGEIAAAEKILDRAA